MKRLVCVLASVLVLVLTVGGDLNGYDRFGDPRGDGEVSYNPDGDDHPWGGDQSTITPNEPLTRNDDRGFGSGNSFFDDVFVRIVVWLLPDTRTQADDSRDIGDADRVGRSNTTHRSTYRHVTGKTSKAER